MSINKKTGSLLAMARRESGLKQDDLAKLLEVSRSTIANIEGGKQNITVALIEEWCDKCDYDIRMVLFPKDEG